MITYDIVRFYHCRRKVIGFSHIVEAAKRANTLGETVSDLLLKIYRYLKFKHPVCVLLSS